MAKSLYGLRAHRKPGGGDAPQRPWSAPQGAGSEFNAARTSAFSRSASEEMIVSTSLFAVPPPQYTPRDAGRPRRSRLERIVTKYDGQPIMAYVHEVEAIPKEHFA